MPADSGSSEQPAADAASAADGSSLDATGSETVESGSIIPARRGEMPARAISAPT